MYENNTTRITEKIQNAELLKLYLNKMIGWIGNTIGY
jgi:hypothetical protein